jgi:hypothetical protein
VSSAKPFDLTHCLRIDEDEEGGLEFNDFVWNRAVSAPVDLDLLAFAQDELARALSLSWRSLSKVAPWGDSFEGISPAGRPVTVERAYLWRGAAGGDILCEVSVSAGDDAGGDAARVSAVIERHAGVA